MNTRTALLGASLILFASAAAAQILPSVPRIDIPRVAGGVLGAANDGLEQSGRTLAAARLDSIAALVRAHPDRIARDPQGFAARLDEVIVTDPSDTLVAAATAKGLAMIERGDAVGVGYARFALPKGMSLASGIGVLRKLGAHDASADQLYGQNGAAASPAAPDTGHGVRIGMIDGGVAGAGTTQRGFATGAPHASDHGTAIASLIVGAGHVKGAAPGARILAADVYGTDPAGGNASAIAKALGWLVAERVSVVTISLVGPPNPLLARVVAAAQGRGTIVVAAVGNDGPAAPPSYPASYPGVIAVTAIDGRKRVLIEAGHAEHLDYAAPGADMVAAAANGGVVSVRGTSFAAPLVAATIALAYPQLDPARRSTALARVDAGAERRDRRYGRGIVCGQCATPPK